MRGSRGGCAAIIETVAGTGTHGYSGPTQQLLRGAAADRSGNLHIADTGRRRGDYFHQPRPSFAACSFTLRCFEQTEAVKFFLFIEN